MFLIDQRGRHHHGRRVSVPLRGLVVFNGTELQGTAAGSEVSVPLRGLVVFNPVLKIPRHTRSFSPVCGAKYFRAFSSRKYLASAFLTSKIVSNLRYINCITHINSLRNTLRRKFIELTRCMHPLRTICRHTECISAYAAKRQAQHLCSAYAAHEPSARLLH